MLVTLECDSRPGLRAFRKKKRDKPPMGPVYPLPHPVME